MPLAPTPWLNPPDYVGAYLHGAQLGANVAESRARLAQQAAAQNAQINMEQQRLQQQAAQNQAELDMKQRLAQQQAAEDQQRMEITKQYHLATVGLQQQKLQETKAVNAAKAQQAAQQAAVAMRARQRIQSGEDAARVWMEEGPAAGMPLSGVAALAGKLSAQAELPEALQTRPAIGPDGKPIPGMVGVPTASGRLVAHNLPAFEKPGSVGEANRIYATMAKEELKELNRKWNSMNFSDDEPPPADKAILLKRWTTLKRQRDALKAKIRQLVPEPGMEEDLGEEIERPRSAATHRYVPGKGIVPIGE